MYSTSTVLEMLRMTYFTTINNINYLTFCQLCHQNIRVLFVVLISVFLQNSSKERFQRFTMSDGNMVHK